MSLYMYVAAMYRVVGLGLNEASYEYVCVAGDLQLMECSQRADYCCCYSFAPNQGSKRDGMDRYGIPALPWPPVKHTSASFLKKDIPVCFTGSFLTFRQLVAGVCIDQWPK